MRGEFSCCDIALIWAGWGRVGSHHSSHIGGNEVGRVERNKWGKNEKIYYDQELEKKGILEKGIKIEVRSRVKIYIC